MAVVAHTDSQLTINTADFSSHVTDVSVDINNDGVDITNFGSGGGPEFVKGLETSMLNFTVLNDFAASSINATMVAAVGTNVPFTAISGPGTTVSATNPSYSGTIYVNAWQPINATPGDVMRVSVSYPVVGTVTQGTT